MTSGEWGIEGSRTAEAASGDTAERMPLNARSSCDSASGAATMAVALVAVPAASAALASVVGAGVDAGATPLEAP